MLFDVTKKYVLDKSKVLYLTQWDDIESSLFNYIDIPRFISHIVLFILHIVLFISHVAPIALYPLCNLVTLIYKNIYLQLCWCFIFDKDQIVFSIL